METLVSRLGLGGSPQAKALVLFLSFVIIALIVKLFVNKVVRRFTNFTSWKLDDKILDAIHGPIFYAIVLVGGSESLKLLAMQETIALYLFRFFNSRLAVIAGVTLVKVSDILIESFFSVRPDSTGLGMEVVPLVENVWKVVVYASVLMVILNFWNVSITPLFASAGIVGAAVAFASKDTIANFFGGVSIFLDRPYKIGDYIVLDAGERGEVVNIGIRSTRILTRDDILISVPNSIIANTKVINESAPEPRFRVRIPVSVAYGSDVDEVERVLLDIAADAENVVKEPEARVRFRAMADSSLNFELLCWTSEPARRGLLVHDLNKTIYKRFAKDGIRIPFPQRDVHIYRETKAPGE